MSRALPAFTLIELLVVVAIIAMLLALLLPSLQTAREQSKRVICGTNQRQILTAMQYYADDHRQKWYMFNHEYNFGEREYDAVPEPDAPNPTWPQIIGGDSVVALAVNVETYEPGDPPFIPGGRPARAEPTEYLKSWDVLTCPSTAHRITRPQHLNNNFDLRYDENDSGAERGHSYEFWNGFQEEFYAGEPPRYDGTQDDNLDHNRLPDCLKRPDLVSSRASKVILMVDGDDPAGEYPDRNNFPDSPLDNHGPEGLNFGFADGHSAWVTPRETYWVLFESDMDVSAVPLAFRP